MSETTPTSGSPKMRSAGRKAMSRMATPAIEPSRAARGTTRRAQSPAKAQPSLITPIATVTPMPIFQAIIGSPREDHRGPQDAEDDPEERRRVETEGHRGHVAPAGAPHQPDREAGVDQVAQEHAGRGARHHDVQDEVGGESEDADQEAREDDEGVEVVEREPEERVPVAGRPPAAGRRRPHRLRRSVAGRDRPRRNSRASVRTRSARPLHHARLPRFCGDLGEAELDRGRGRRGTQPSPSRRRTP